MCKTEVPSRPAVCQRSIGTTTLTYRLYRTRGAFGLLISSDAQATDRIRVDGITEDPYLAKNLQRLLAENLVFPSSVAEVLDDLLVNMRCL